MSLLRYCCWVLLPMTVLVGKVAQAAIPLATSSQPDPAVMSLVYDPTDGNLRLHAAGQHVTTLEVMSHSAVFTGVQPSQVQPPFDVYLPGKFFLLKTDGMGDEDFGRAIIPGLTGDALAADLSVDGSIMPEGALPAMTLVVVPEPASLCLPALAATLLLMRRLGADGTTART